MGEDSDLVAPVHTALTAPLLFMGCDRDLFFVAASVVGMLLMLGLAERSLVYAAVAVVVAVASYGALRRMAKEDPHAAGVFLQALSLRQRYDAVPRWDRRAGKPRSW